MSPSVPGLVGAGVGLVLALATYVMMSNAMLGPLQKLDTPTEERERIERSWSTMRLVLLADFVVLAGFGYYAGVTVWS